MIDKTTLFLFSPFEERGVGNPNRGKIKGFEHFRRFLDANNGINDCFVSLHNLNVGYTTKLWLDFDGKEEIDASALEEAQRMYQHLVSKNISVIPVASGNPNREGIHLHILTKPIQIGEDMLKAKEYIANLTYTIIDDVFGHDEENKLLAKTIDYPLITDINRIVRVPGTLRPPQNLTWCTYLPENFIRFTEYDLKKHIRRRHYYDYDLFNPLDNTKMEIKTDLLPPHKSNKVKQEDEYTGLPITISESAKMLENIIRPCLFKEIISPNPINEVRVAVTIDLLQFFPVEFIIDLYRGLNWVDFDEDVTRKFINYAKPYKPYSCDALRRKGLIRKCDC